MMRWAALVCGTLATCLLVGIAPSVSESPQGAAAPLSDAEAQQAEQLISTLSSDTWQARQQAQDALVQIGLDLRPRLLRLMRQTRDEEVRTRAEAALGQIEENRISGISYITLHMKQALPKEIFANLSR